MHNIVDLNDTIVEALDTGGPGAETGHSLSGACSVFPTLQK